MADEQEKRWSKHIARLRDAPESKALGVCLALASEMFLLKAENKRLQMILRDKTIIGPADQQAAAESPAFRQWLAAEQLEFARSIFGSWLETDQSPDVSGEYEREADPSRST